MGERPPPARIVTSIPTTLPISIKAAASSLPQMLFVDSNHSLAIRGFTPGLISLRPAGFIRRKTQAMNSCLLHCQKTMDSIWGHSIRATVPSPTVVAMMRRESLGIKRSHQKFPITNRSRTFPITGRPLSRFNSSSIQFLKANSIAVSSSAVSLIAAITPTRPIAFLIPKDVRFVTLLEASPPWQPAHFFV